MYFFFECCNFESQYLIIFRMFPGRKIERILGGGGFKVDNYIEN